MTLGLRSQGATLKVTISSTPTVVGGITSMTLNATMDTVDVTAHDDFHRQFLAGVPDGGELTFDLNLTPTNAAQKYLFTSMHPQGSTHPAAEVFLITSNDKTTTDTSWGFSGYVTNFSKSDPVGGAITASLTVKVTGLITQTDGS